MRGLFESEKADDEFWDAALEIAAYMIANKRPIHDYANDMKDAVRYRWLRSAIIDGPDDIFVVGCDNNALCGDALDAAIDEAIQLEKKDLYNV